LINDDFLYLLATRIKTGGALEIATDDAEYAAVIAATLAGSSHFQNRLSADFATEDAERIVTKYERQAQEARRTCHYFKWQRTETPAIDRFPLPQEFPMPHMILRTPLTLEEIGRRFTPSTIEQGDIRVKFIECYRSLHDGKLLVETFVMESLLQQRVCLSLRLHTVKGTALEPSKVEVMIGLHDTGFPRPTRGIHIAIDYLGKWLREIAPGTEIAHSNLVNSE
jgi:tRNA (guanine-N7-)-methyltransferase